VIGAARRAIRSGAGRGHPAGRSCVKRTAWAVAHDAAALRVRPPPSPPAAGDDQRAPLAVDLARAKRRIAPLRRARK